MGRREWRYSEEKILIDNYSTKTIKELETLLPGRNPDSINSKIKRLKAENKLQSNKTDTTKKRSYQQRERINSKKIINMDT